VNPHANQFGKKRHQHMRAVHSCARLRISWLIALGSTRREAKLLGRNSPSSLRHLLVVRQAGQRTGEKILQLRTHARRLAAALADDLSGLLVVDRASSKCSRPENSCADGGILQRAPNRLFQLWA